MTRLAIVCTHPIQYYAPVFSLLARQTDLVVKVFYGWKGLTEVGYDPGFGGNFAWDIPLLEGYDWEFVPNVAKDPGSHHYKGIDLPQLNDALESWQPDAILIYGWAYKAHLKAIRYFHGKVPVFFRGDSTLLGEYPGWRRFARQIFLRWVYRHVDIAFYVGTQNRKYYEAHGLSPEQLVFAPHAIDNHRYAANGELNGSGTFSKSQEIRQSLGIADNQVKILYAGKIEYKKATDLLIKAYQSLPTGRAQLVIVGTGPLQQQLMQVAGPAVHFVGFKNQSELPDWYRAADVVVLPSRGPIETWGLTMNEAMAASRAVIASNRVGSAIDLIEDHVNGWIFKTDDLQALAKCLETATSLGRHGLAEMGDRSSLIIKNWTFERQVEAITATTLQFKK